MTHKYYADEPSFHVAVDCIIFGFEDGNLQVLFQHRNIEPFNGELTPMGAFAPSVRCRSNVRTLPLVPLCRGGRWLWIAIDNGQLSDAPSYRDICG